VEDESSAVIEVPTAPGQRDGVGASPGRPDGRLKVKGEFAFSSDLWAEGMLWGVTLRSPHPHARIRGIDLAGALTTPGVSAVMTHEDVPGENSYGLERPDQPVLAADVVRFQGEPVAVVAADHPEAARRAAQRIEVDYEVLEPVTDPEAAIDGSAAPIHPGGNVLRHIHVRHGDVEAARAQADVVITGEYEMGMQDQAFLGPESGLAIPAEDGGVDLYVATQWLHVDRRQVARSLGMPEEKVRITLAGVGGAFGGREDLSIHVHACMLALYAGRPVKMIYSREESFFGHVHRHPAWMRFEHGATRDGRLLYVAARVVLDGGAYASSSPAVCLNAASTAAGPYDVPNADIDSYLTYTNNPPCGAMRGFGAVQVCFAYEAMMDRLAAEVGISPVEIRRRNAMTEGTVMPTGQVVDGPAPVATLLDRVEAMPLPPESGNGDLRGLPGGVSNTTHGEGVRRGVGYAVGFKNVGFSGGFDDYSTARVRMLVAGGEPVVEVHTAAAEVGQGAVTVHAQIARTELGVDQVTVLPADTQVGNAGSSSASRQTWLTGGAVKGACEAVRERVLRLAADRLGETSEPLVLSGGRVATAGGAPLIDLVDVLGDTPVEETREYRPRATSPIDPDTGQGDVHMAFAFAAHRAVVDVDVELGLVKVVEIATAQDVGRAMNPVAVEGQIDGGIAQGVGLALMEEIQVADGLVRNPSFTDYLIPTILDMPSVRKEILELLHPESPYGLNGVGEPPTISSTPAIVAALRDATGRPLTRVPIRPDAIVGLEAGGG
jgi:xanthine dehydrogenase D subunit